MTQNVIIHNFIDIRQLKEILLNHRLIGFEGFM